MSGAIIFEGDFIRDREHGGASRVEYIDNWDENGDACLHLENGRCINSKDVKIEDVLLESEVQ